MLREISADYLAKSAPGTRTSEFSAAGDRNLAMRGKGFGARHGESQELSLPFGVLVQAEHTDWSGGVGRRVFRQVSPVRLAKYIRHVVPDQIHLLNHSTVNSTLPSR